MMEQVRIKFIIGFLVFFIPWCVYSQQVIVNSDNEITELPKSTLKAIFSMRLRTWPDGTPVTVFIQNPDNKIHQEFCLAKLDVFPYQIQRTWDVLVYSGMGQSPFEVKNEIEMKQKVGQIKGAIGYISKLGEVENVRSILVH